MRFFCVFILLALAASAQAQKQERSLVDRLLKPDTSLTNTSFNRQFDAGKSAQTASASTRAFYVSEKNLTRNFTEQRSFVTREAVTKSAATKPAVIQPSVKVKSYETGNAANTTQSFPVSTKGTKAYAGNRAFVPYGKSQKSLDRKNPPMTIDQVRELLNKNK